MRTYRGLFISVLGLLFVTAANAFPTHVSPSALTLAPGRVQFQPFPGSNPLTPNGFLLNSLSIGVFERLEIGTVPLLWGGQEGYSVTNFNLKGLVYRGEKFFASVGTQSIVMTPAGEAKQYFDSVTINQVGISLEYQQSRYLQYRFNLAQSQMVTKNQLMYRFGKTELRWDEHRTGGFDYYLDIAMAASDTNSWVLGMSYNRDWLSGLLDQSTANYGVGLSHGWKLKGSFLSGFSLGLHLRERSGPQGLFSAVF